MTFEYDPTDTVGWAEYETTTLLYLSRLDFKHELKGVSHRRMNMLQLLDILKDEVRELEQAISNDDMENMIEEALDVMICGNLFVDNILHNRRVKTEK